MERPDFNVGFDETTLEKGGGSRHLFHGIPSYKEVSVGHHLLRTSKDIYPFRWRCSFSLKCKRLEKPRRGRRCYRWLASDHFVAACRDLVRCLSCRKIGHRASHYNRAAHKKEGEPKSVFIMERENHKRGRVLSSKAYIPYTEEFLRRSELKCNAMLVDVVQPADLGLVPQQTLANALTRRFGGYSHNFFVARYRKSDYMIILPGWVPTETLIRRHLITLEDIWLRFYNGGSYWNTRPHRSRYTAWIQLQNVPFECWTPASIASMISGFGRFIRADDISKKMTDLRAYRCRIAVDDIREIPQCLAIVMGDEIVNIFVHLENSEQIREGG